MRIVYDMRSSLVHGDDWTSGLKKRNKPQMLGLDRNEKKETIALAIFYTLKEYID